MGWASRRERRRSAKRRSDKGETAPSRSRQQPSKKVDKKIDSPVAATEETEKGRSKTMSPKKISPESHVSSDVVVVGSPNDDAVVVESSQNTNVTTAVATAVASTDAPATVPTDHTSNHGKLEDQTFRYLKTYLEKTEILDQLQEEEITNRLVKTNKIALERSRYRSSLVEAAESDDENDFYEEVYQQEEEFMLTNDFFKKVITDINEQLKVQQQQPSASSSLSASTQPLGKLDKRTVNWLKRAMGLERNDDHWYLAPNDLIISTAGTEDSDHNHGSGGGGIDVNDMMVNELFVRRLTRGVARSTRIKRRQERTMRENMGLQAMVQAIDELEETYGPFGKNKRGARHSQQHHRAGATATNGNARRSKKKGVNSNNAEALIAHMPIISAEEKSSNQQDRTSKNLRPRKSVADNNYRVVRLVRILVGRKHIRPIRQRQLLDGQEEPQNSTQREEPTRKKRATKRRASVTVQEDNEDDGNDDDSSAPQVSIQLPPKKRIRLDRLYDLESADEENEPLPEGRLFGSVHPNHLVGLSSSHFSTKDPIPLRLLDWQRRQSSMNTKGHTKVLSGVNPNISLPPILRKAGIGYLPQWKPGEVMAPVDNDDVASKPIPLDPPRGRYTDEEYATYCARVINCLNGPARAWTRYEFFYSDVDRAWYNFNEFAVDVAKLGVSPSMRFTRKEWSMIRRRIPNRPRLFSKRFIFSQIQKRNQYRDAVRRLQANPDTNKNFDYEVTARIPVGATVTAYNKRYRILHRGTVLFHDSNGHGYLVLFERKQLGYEFCPDTEVASHGVPQIIRKAPAVMLDGSTLGATIDHNSQPGHLPYGTSLNPPNGVRPIESVNLATKLMEVKPPGKETETRDEVLVKGSEEQMADKVSEREILVRLLQTIEAATDRKSMILDAIEKCQEVGEAPPETTDAIAKSPERLQQHYAWLLANLELTNNSLDAALLQMRVMFGKAYDAGNPHQQQVDQSLTNLSKEALIQRVSRMDKFSREMSAQWMFSIIMDCKETGSKTASTLAATKFGILPGRHERHSYLQHRLAAATALLFAAAYCMDRFVMNCHQDSSRGVVATAPVYEVFCGALENLKLTVLPSDNSDSRVLEADASRWFEARDLEEATKILYAEIAASSAQLKALQTNNS